MPDPGNANAPPPDPNGPSAVPTLDIVQLYAGDTVGAWRIKKKLGEGGFGAVYLVEDRTDKISKGEFALKTEKATEKVRVLKMEVYVLSELKRCGAAHFCQLIDRGRVKDYNYVVMTLVGPSFHDLRKSSETQKFSPGCACSVGIQCIEAVEELHKIGYIHRDLKPGNFAISKADSRHVIMLDFGMARKFLDDKNQPRQPRWAAGFRGTVRYAPLSCHISRDHCRKDDLEVWLYMQVELTRGSLPWKSIEDREEVGRYKERCRTEGLKELFGGCPKEYADIMFYVDTLCYYDTPNYAKIMNLLRTSIQINNFKEFPYDWEK